MSGRKLLPALIVATITCLTPAGAVASPGLSSDWQRGANVTSWWHDAYEQPKADQELVRLRANGTTHASFIATWYMNDRHDSTVAPDPQRTPSDASLLHAIAKAKSLGMSVTLKPHVDLRDDSFRGSIAPSNPSGWFSDYRSMIAHYSDLARQSGADMLIVGTELSTMTPYEAQWRELIADARARFSGTLTFAANHTDGAAAIAFWDALDYIGIDAYMPLSASDPNPPAETIAKNWCGLTDQYGNAHHYVEEISKLQARWNRPVIFTELGYESKVGAVVTPWGGSSGAVSQQAQANAYEAALAVWSRVPWFKGIYWWNWDTGSGNDNVGGGGFEFAGKQAEATVAAWNSGALDQTLGPPCQAAAPQPAHKTSVTLSVAKRKGKRKRNKTVSKLRGQLRLGTKPCSQAVVVSIKPRGKRRGRATRLRLRPRTALSGQFKTKLRRLRPGRYRAQATTKGARCGNARSATLRFRVRR